MKKALGWILGALAVLLVLTIFFFGVWVWRGGCCGWRGYYGGWGMHGPGMMWGYAPFGWLGMLFMALIPFGFLALTVLGIVWLVRIASGSAASSTNKRTCPHCGTQVQAHWTHCPLCGASLL